MIVMGYAMVALMWGIAAWCLKHCWDEQQDPNRRV